MIIAVLMGVAMTLFAVTLSNFFNGNHLVSVKETDGTKEFHLSFFNVGSMDWVYSLGLGVVTFLGYYSITLKKPWLAIIVSVLMIGTDIFLAWWWYQGGDVLREVIVFAFIATALCFLFRGNAYIVSVLWDNAFLTKLVTLLPLIGLIGLIGFAVSDMFFYHRNSKDVVDNENDIEEIKRKNAAAERHLAFGWAARVLAIIIALIVVITTFTACGGDNKSETDTGVWYKFYNTELQKDKDETNNFNFGSNPAKKSWSAKDYDKNFRETLRNDPAIGAADMAWFDANMGTRYLGEFYESCKKDWAKTMNSAKEHWMNHQDEYYQTLDAFFAFLDTGTSEVTKADNLTDQMYMNPYTSDKVPDIIVMETLDHKGMFLTYTFKIKGSSSTTGGKLIAVSYRINCRYQPTNVAEVMGITPQSTPKSSKPSNPDTPYDPTTKPSDPTKPTEKPSQPETVKPTEPNTDPTYNKDKTKGTQGDVVGPNDDPGPGPDTNNGVGATTSTKDQPENSDHLGSYEEYREKMDELEEINENQKTGSDSNTPSTKSASGTKVDSNADNGTGNGGINTPTPTTAPAKTSSGEPISNTPDNPAGAWGGPPD